MRGRWRRPRRSRRLPLATIQRGVQGSRAPRSARLRGPADQPDFADGDEVHQHAALHRRRGPPGDGAADRRRQDLSRRLLRGEDGAGRTRARDRHVRAAGSPERHGRARHSAPAVRQRRLDALLPDGREVRLGSGTTSTGPLQEIEGLASPMPGTVAGTAARPATCCRRAVNDAFTVANRVMKANGEVSRLGAPMTANGKTYPAGSFYVAASATSTPIVQKRRAGARRQHRRGRRAARRRRDAAAPRGASRCGTRTTGSMPSGWTRYLLERFEFPFTVVCGAGFDDTALRVEVRRDRHAVGRGLPRRRRRRPRRWRWWRRRCANRRRSAAPRPSTDPDLRSLCQVTTGTGTGATAEANVKKFVEAGGTVIAAGSAARIDRGPARPSGVRLSRRAAAGPAGACPERRQVLRAGIGAARRGRQHRAVGGWAAEDHIDVFFNNSPVFRLAPDRRRRRAFAR